MSCGSAVEEPKNQEEFLEIIRQWEPAQRKPKTSPSTQLTKDNQVQMETSSEKTDEKALVSPHGFGSYPVIPEGMGNFIWKEHSANSELMIRVKLKLISEGINVRGATTMDGKVYPTIKGIVYVNWDRDFFGLRRYISGHMCTGEDGARLRAIRGKNSNRRKIRASDVPLDIKLIDMDKAGIDPYEFLGLPIP